MQQLQRRVLDEPRDRPNCGFSNKLRVDAASGLTLINVLAKRDIKEGDNLLAAYGRGYPTLTQGNQAVVF